jgi:hypothetical protein
MQSEEAAIDNYNIVTYIIEDWRLFLIKEEATIFYCKRPI